MITDSFDIKSEPLISLRDVYGEKRDLADICIVTFSEVIYRHVLESRECHLIAEISAVSGNIPIYAFDHAGKTVAFYQSPIGATLAAQCIAETNWLTGADKFIMFGSAGSLDIEKTAGKFVIPTDAYRDEGMSYHYAPADDYIRIKTSAALQEIFDRLGAPYVSGRVWTTDAILRETKGEATRRRAEGCIAVEMEIAGVEAVCDFYNIDLYPFVVTGDVLSDDGYSLGSLSDANHNVDKFALALKIAENI